MLEQFIIFKRSGVVLFNKCVSKVSGNPVNDLIQVLPLPLVEMTPTLLYNKVTYLPTCITTLGGRKSCWRRGPMNSSSSLVTMG
jgi:hypothetical protein